MWSVLRRQPAIRVALGQARWAVFPAGGAASTGEATGWLHALEQAGRVLASVRQRPAEVAVLLTGRLCPALWLTPPVGLKRGEEWRAWLPHGAAVEHPLGDALIDPAVWSHASRPGPTLAAAIPKAWLQEFQSALEPSVLRSVRPIWSVALDRMQRRGRSSLRHLTVFDGESVTALDADSRGFLGARSLPHDADIAAARAWHHRRLVGMNAAGESARFEMFDALNVDSGKRWCDAWVSGDSP